MTIVLLSRFKNERHILYEWVHHHLSEGIDKIILIDHHSTDDYLNLNPWIPILIARNKLEILKSRSDNQIKDYQQALSRVKKYDWLILLDLDEFIFTPKNLCLKIILEKFQYNYIKIKWKMFTHQDKLQPKSVIENNLITHSSKIDKTSPSGIKYIVKTKIIKKILIHEPQIYKSQEIKELFLNNAHNEFIQINHYRTQSDFYLYNVKRVRGGGVNKDKYKDFELHQHSQFDKTCDILKNKRKDLIEIINKMEPVLPLSLVK